ncbi:MAG: hypothetical protein J6S65_00965, partial [Bacteroidaceae bacterium]|nr:hypothetical protein [Bacteroidaceae bacterium]
MKAFHSLLLTSYFSSPRGGRVGAFSLILLFSSLASAQDWQLVWHDEFDGTGPLNTEVWKAEHGFVRNEEYQWYQEQNAYRQDGILILEGKLDSIPNPRYKAGSRSWQRNSPYARYSSASVNTRGTYSFLY